MMFQSKEVKAAGGLSAFLEKHEPVIIMGRGHSGTRVLTYACTYLGLNLGATGVGTGDVDDTKFTSKLKKISSKNIGAHSQDQINNRDLKSFQEAVYHFHERLGAPESNWGWKFPETYLIGPYIAKTFPKAKYIHLIRDGRDIAFKQHSTDDPKNQLGKKILTHLNAMGYESYLQSAASWEFQVDNFDKFRHTLDPNQVVDVRFEDLCASPHETMQALSEFLKLPFTDACKKYLDEKVNKNKISQYLENEPKQIQEVESLISATLKRYGYLK